MTTEEFRKQFKQIVYLKGKVVSAENKVKMFTRFDKNGSHTKAILQAIESKNRYKEAFINSLGDWTYEQWCEKSESLTKLTAKLKQSNFKKFKYSEEVNFIENAIKSLINGKV